MSWRILSLFFFCSTLFLGCVHHIDYIADEEIGKVFIVRGIYEKPENELNQPYLFKESELGTYLEDIYFTYDQIIRWSPPRLVFSEKERAFLRTHLTSALQAAGPKDEVRFQTWNEGFRNRASLKVRNQYLELLVETFAGESYENEDQAYVDGVKTKWRLSPGKNSKHLTRPQIFGRDEILYNTLKTPLAKVVRKNATTKPAVKKETLPQKDKKNISGSDLDLEQKWLNEEIERAKREEEKAILEKSQE